MGFRHLAIVLAVFLPNASAPVRAENVPRSPPIASDGFVPPPKHRLVLNNLFGVRLNPMGVEDQIRLGYQLRLLDRTNKFLRDTFFFAGIAPRLNPAFVKIGPSIEIQPSSIFNLRVGVEYMGFFSTLGFMQSYDSALAAYDDRTQRAGQNAHANYGSSGLHVYVEPTLTLKVGPVVFRDKVAFEYWRMNMREGDRVFYEITLDTLVPGRGWVITNDLDVLYMHPNPKYRFTLGLRYSVVKPLYRKGDFAPGENTDLEDNQHQRVGPLFAYTFFDHAYAKFDRPTLIVVANWYVDARYRRGQADSAIVPGKFAPSTGVPYVVLGFSFQCDLLQSRH